MKVIGVMNQKGGTGKTTISVNLCACLNRQKKRVVLVDADYTQGSASDWAAMNEGRYFDVLVMKPDAIKGFIDRNKGKYDYLVIDCPPRANREAALLINPCDLILMPVQPSPYDIWASTELCELIKTRQEIVKGMNMPQASAFFILSRAARNARLVDEALMALNDIDMPVFKSGTTQYEAYKRCVADGHSIFDADEKNGAAINQIKTITREVLVMLGEEGIA